MALTQISTDGIKNGTITGSDLATNIDLVDNQKIRFGTGADLSIYHTGSNSFIDESSGVGSLYVRTNAFQIQKGAGVETMAQFLSDGAVNLYYNNSKKFETLTDGIKVSSDNSSIEIASSSAGTSTAFVKFKGYRTSADIGRLGEIQFINQRDNDIQAQIEVFSDGDTNAYFDFIASTNNNRTFRVYPSSIAFPDNNKLICGNSSDLQIFHDGVDNHIDASQTLSIKMGGETSAQFDVNGAVHLYYDNSKKLETINEGVKVLGASTQAQVRLQTSDGTTRGYFYANSINEVYVLDAQGHLVLKGIKDGAAELYHDNSKKFETTLTGVKISSGLASSGGMANMLQLENLGNNSGDGSTISFSRAGTIRAELQAIKNETSNNETDFVFRTTDAGSVFEALRIVGDTGNLRIPNDSGKLQLGASQDLQLFHDGSDSFIVDQGTGRLNIRTNGDSIKLQNTDGGTEAMGIFNSNGSVELYHNGSKKFETASHGLFYDGTGGDTYWYDGSGSNPLKWLYTDNVKNCFGTGSDLQIYHDGTENRVASASGINHRITTDQLIVNNAANNEEMFKAIGNGACELYYNAAKKLETTSAGVQVTGALNVTTTMHIPDGNIGLQIGSSNDLTLNHNGTDSYITSSTGNFVIQHTNNSGDLIMKANDFYLRSNTNENYFRGQVDGAVDLYHDNLVRLSTRSDGIKVTSEGNTPVVRFEGASSNAVGAIDCDQKTPTTSDMRFFTENNGGLGERVRLKHNNAIMINTTSNPTSNAEGYVNLIVDNGRDGFNIRHNHSGNCINLWRANGDGGLIHFYRGNSSQNGVGSISVNSSSTSYNESSDYRLKENVTAISDGITRLKTLKPSRFNFKVDKDKTVDGFLAHEVTLAVPEAITGTKDEVDSKNNPIYQQIDKSKLVPLLVAAVQELIAKVEALEAG